MDSIRNTRMIEWIQKEFPRVTQLRVFDHFLSLFMVTPLIVGYYKGLFFSMEYYLFPMNLPLNLCLTGIFGYGMVFSVFICQDLLEPLTHAPQEPAFYFLSRLYNLVLALANVSKWYFLWVMSDRFVANSLGGVLRTLVVSTMLMMCLRCYPSVCAVPPFYLVPKQANAFFKAPTRFGCKSSKSLLKFTLDVAFSVFVVNSLVVLIWKNTWTLLDLALYPDDFQSTTAASLSIGLCQTIAVYYFQSTAYAVATKLHNLPRIIFVNCWLWFTGFTCINVWRGVWYLGDLFVDVEIYGAWLPILCLLFLQTFFSDNVVATKGTIQEHDYFPEKAKAVFYPISYFQTLCKVERPEVKKQSVKLLNQKEQEIKAEKKEVTYVCPANVKNGVPETQL